MILTSGIKCQAIFYLIMPNGDMRYKMTSEFNSYPLNDDNAGLNERTEYDSIPLHDNQRDELKEKYLLNPLVNL